MEIHELTAALAEAANTEVMQIDLAASEKRIKVDMSTRKITGNMEFGVQFDHLAKKIVFEVTRYEGDADLGEKHCAIHWENGKNGGVLPVTGIDLSEEGVILMQWDLTNEFTQFSGDIVFALHFFSIVDNMFTYHSATYSIAGKLGKTLNASNHSVGYIVPSEIEKLIQVMNDMNNAVAVVNANTAKSKEYMEQTKMYYENAAAVTGVGIATEDTAGLIKGGENTIDEDGSLVLMRKVSGSRITADDSHAGGLKLDKLYGKSIQDGTPTPDVPVEIKSAGDSGSVAVKAVGKNLFKNTNNVSSSHGITRTQLDDGGYNFAGTATANVWAQNGIETEIPFDGVYTLSIEANVYTSKGYMFQHRRASEEIKISSKPEKQVYTAEMKKGDTIQLLVGASLNEVVNSTVYVQLENVSIATAFKPYTEQTLTLNRTLPAIPVTDESLATYTDENGQMWCSDEIDAERGVYVQRVLLETIALSYQATASASLTNCDRYKGVVSQILLGGQSGGLSSISHKYSYSQNDTAHFFIGPNDTGVVFYVPKGTAPIEATVLGILATPIETPLTDEEIIALHSLKTYDGITHIMTDNDPAPMLEVEYGASEVGALSLENSNLHVVNEVLKLNKTDVVDNLESTDANLPLSANQGRVIKNIIDNVGQKISVFSIQTTVEMKANSKSDFEITWTNNPEETGVSVISELYAVSARSSQAGTNVPLNYYIASDTDDVFVFKGSLYDLSGTPSYTVTARINVILIGTPYIP